MRARAVPITPREHQNRAKRRLERHLEPILAAGNSVDSCKGPPPGTRRVIRQNLWLWRKRRKAAKTRPRAAGVSRPRARYVALCIGLGTEGVPLCAAHFVTYRQ